jgi:hypothetical protein
MHYQVAQGSVIQKNVMGCIIAQDFNKKIPVFKAINLKSFSNSS